MASRASDGLPPEEIIARIKKALRFGGETHTWADVQEKLAAGLFQIFWNAHGCVITEIIQNPRSRHLRIFLAAGQMPGLEELHDVVEDYARQEGCAYILASGRNGWERHGAKRGWRKAQITLRKDL